MNSDLQRPASSHPFASTIPIAKEASGLIAPLASFHSSPQHLAPFRGIGDPEIQHSPQITSQAVDAIAIGDATQEVPYDASLVPSMDRSFQQPNYGTLTPDVMETTSFAGQLQGMKLILDPPDLGYWRQKLFDVDETIILSEEQYALPCLCPIRC